MDRTRRLSELMMSRHPEVFGTDFEKNKEALEDLAIVSSKQLRNRIAGYIAKSLKQDAVTEESAPAPEEQA